MLSAFLITLREGLEAALIIGIILACLARSGNRQRFKYVWLGTLLALVASLISGAAIFIVAGKLEGQAEVLLEGIAMLAAACLLTWMIFWMRHQAANIRVQLQTQIESALGSGSSLGLIVLAFVAVAREGIETVLFLFAATVATESPLLSTAGGLLGVLLALVIGYGVYKGTSKLNLKVFFNVTGLLLILFAAGLLARGIHELHEAEIIPPVVEHVWDINPVLPEKSILGRFLTDIFGYNASPSLVEAVAYAVYLGLILIAYFRPTGAQNGPVAGRKGRRMMTGSPAP